MTTKNLNSYWDYFVFYVTGTFKNSISTQRQIILYLIFLIKMAIR